jgi:hypothetical protein
MAMKTSFILFSFRSLLPCLGGILDYSLALKSKATNSIRNHALKEIGY